MIRGWLPKILISISLSVCAYDAVALDVNIAYLKLEQDAKTATPIYLRTPPNSGLAGAELSMKDSNGAGKFLGHKYSLLSAMETNQDALISRAESFYQSGTKFYLVDSDAATLKRLQSALPQTTLIVNVNSPDQGLRTQQCLSNVVHTAPSYRMLSDAIAQWLRYKKLTKVLLITGSTEQDLAMADSARASIQRLGLQIVADKPWTFDADLRRSTAKEIPQFTQYTRYDAVWVVDMHNVFGQYIPYNTWLPRPVVGTHGLRADNWHPAIEQWAAIQLQHRFIEQSNRFMNPLDYSAWVAVRALNAAITQTNSVEPDLILKHLLNSTFEFGAYKGRKLSFRYWNGQLRQPIPLAHPNALVASAPLEGYLHPTNDMDTLGADKQDSTCDLTDSKG
ncbi:ABC transporter substrate-binding protein [Vibrio sp. S9_S30]|nr:ABC transporter substrate-binding protein [Vibrio sp. S9_S30]